MSYKFLYIITGLTEIIKNKKNNYFTGNDVQADENLTKDTTSTPATISTGT